MKLKKIQHLVRTVKAFIRGFVNCFVDMLSALPVCLDCSTVIKLRTLLAHTCNMEMGHEFYVRR